MSVFSREKKILLLLLLFVLLRFLRLDFPQQLYFDEVYHAFTAGEILKANPAAWEYWAKPPEGVAYEWTHPPLAKLVMAGGIFVFGSPIGWRLPGALFGLFAVYLVYLLAKEILKEKRIALFSAFLFSLEGLPFVVSRIGMAEIYFLTFALLTLLLFLKRKYFWSAVFFGSALATKWTAAFLLPLLFLAWLLSGKRFTRAHLWYLILPPILYFFSYLPFFLTGHNLGQWWETQRQMWGYHTNLAATHPYSSPWWSWPLALRPVWYFTQETNGLVSNIYASGNPVIFWGGLAAVLIGVVYVYKKKDKNLALLLAGYFLMFLPWAVSPRIMFLHHYLPAIPFMVLLLAWLLNTLWQKSKRPVVIGYLALAILSFAFYYPLWIGLPMPPWWADLLIP